MDDESATVGRGALAPGPERARRTGAWLLVLVIVGALLACGCAAVVFLVLTGIIAEPETVIEQIVRTLLGS